MTSPDAITDLVLLLAILASLGSVGVADSVVATSWPTLAFTTT